MSHCVIRCSKHNTLGLSCYKVLFLSVSTASSPIYKPLRFVYPTNRYITKSEIEETRKKYSSLVRIKLKWCHYLLRFSHQTGESTIPVSPISHCLEELRHLWEYYFMALSRIFFHTSLCYFHCFYRSCLKDLGCL